MVEDTEMDDLDLSNPFEEPTETETSESPDTEAEAPVVEADETEVVNDDTEGEVEAEDQSANESKEESEVEEPEQGTETEEESTESEDEATKRHNAEMAQRRIAEREAKQRQQAEMAQKQQEYLDAAETDAELRIRQLEVQNQKAQYEAYEQTVQSNNTSLLNDYSQVQSDPETQIFNEKSDSFNKRQFERMQRAYEAENLQVDQQGNIVGVKESFYKYAKEWAKDWNVATKTAEGKARTTVKRNLAKSEPASNSTGKLPAKSDPILDLWESDDD